MGSRGAAAPEIVPQLKFDSSAPYVERGAGAVGLLLDLAKYCLNRGDRIPRI